MMKFHQRLPQSKQIEILVKTLYIKTTFRRPCQKWIGLTLHEILVCANSRDDVSKHTILI